jgi:rhodanese-related sulfurtransferase
MSKKHPRIVNVQQAHEMLAKDPSVLLVCAYEKEEDFRKNDLEGAISLSDFRKQKDSLPKDENIIFYCACPHDEAATKEARQYFGEGFTNARILQGGVDAWKEAGFGMVRSIA